MSSTTVVDGETYYYETFVDVETINLIFSNGSGGQTADITGMTSDTYFTYDGSNGYTIVESGSGGGGGGDDPEPSTDKQHAFFINTQNWASVYCWVWESGQSGYDYLGVNWPGKLCTKLSVTYNGSEIWEWVYDGTKTTAPYGIIFNNGSGQQTSDLIYENGGYYNASGKITNASVIADLETLTGIHHIDNGIVVDEDNAIYSLDGRKVPAGPLPKGIYIMNKKKFIVR